MVSRFEVYLINLDEVPSADAKNTRPAVVISPDELNRNVETVIIALKAIMGVPDRPNRVFREEEDTPPNVLVMRRVVNWCITEYYGSGDDVPLRDG